MQLGHNFPLYVKMLDRVHMKGPYYLAKSCMLSNTECNISICTLEFAFDFGFFDEMLNCAHH